MPAKTLRVPSSPRSSVSFRSLSAPATSSAFTTFATRRSTRKNSSMEIKLPSTAAAFARIASDAAAGGETLRAGLAAGAAAGARSARRPTTPPRPSLVRPEQRIELLRSETRHQVLVGVDSRAQHGAVVPREGPIKPEQFARDALRESRQHRRDEDAEEPESLQRP